MRVFATSIHLLTLVICMCAGGCSGKQGLVGLWQTETVRAALPGRTNFIDAYQTVEFLRDGSFKMGGGVITDGKRRAAAAAEFTGTYALIDANRLRLEVAPNQARPSDRIPLTVTFSLVGDELQMSKLITSAIPESQKYRRVKR
jgi:hypothetical protein